MNIWPGFVDGLATILLVVIFVLLVFLAGQFFLSLRLSGREAQLERLNSQIDELAELLTLERQISADLGLTVGRVSEELRGSQAERDRLAAQVGMLDAERSALDQSLQAALSDIDRLSESQTRLTEEREELRAALDARSAERDRLDAGLAALEAERASLRGEIEVLSSQRLDLKQQIETLDVERGFLASTLEASEQRAAALDRSLTASQEEVEALSRTRERLTTSLAALETQLAEVLERIRQVQEERARLSSELAQLDQVRSELAQALETSDLERGNLAEQVASLESELTGVEEARESLAAALAESEAERGALLARLADGNATIAAVEREAAGLAAELGVSQDDGSTLESLLASLRSEVNNLRDERDSLAGDNLANSSELEAARRKLEADWRTIEVQLGEIAALKSLRDDLEARVATLGEQQAEADERSAAFEALSEEAEQRIVLLNQQLAALRLQLGDLNAALDAAETLNREQEAQIVDLGRRLNVALATKVQELARYRSEFFGRLREVLGDTAGIQVVGDRFVFQSEVLFDTAEAELEPAGREQLTQLARTLIEVGQRIPEDVDWVLRVDGHTDDRPIATEEFPSNWELSSARALSVVRYLIAQGIPAERLVAAGFGEFQPIANGNDPESLRRNRRIEMKLTQR